MYMYVFMYGGGRSKGSKSHQERKAITEYFCSSNTLSLLINLEKLIQISVIIFIRMRPIQR